MVKQPDGEIKVANGLVEVPTTLLLADQHVLVDVAPIEVLLEGLLGF